MLGASQALNGAAALQSQFNGQLGAYGQIQQDKAQGDIDQAYNDWYQRNYGYDQQRINNIGNVLSGISGNYQGSSTSGANPAYKPRTAGGALGSAAAGAAAGTAIMPGWGTAVGGAVGALSYYL